MTVQGKVGFVFSNGLRKYRCDEPGIGERKMNEDEY
jgi:hypothetical protein